MGRRDSVYRNGTQLRIGHSSTQDGPLALFRKAAVNRYSKLAGALGVSDSSLCDGGHQ